MSYDINIVNPDTGETRVFEEKHNVTGGTYSVGGTNEAWLNITYNYAGLYYQMCGFNVRTFSGLTVSEVLPTVKSAIKKLGTDRYFYDYWAPTLGNAGGAMADLLTLLDLCEPTDTVRVS